MKLKLCLLAIVLGISIFASIEIFQSNNTKQDKLKSRNQPFSKSKTPPKLIIDQTLQSSNNNRAADFSMKKLAATSYLARAETSKINFPIHIQNTDGVDLENVEIELILYGETSEIEKTDANGISELKIEFQELLPLKITHKDYETKLVLIDFTSLYPNMAPYKVILEKGRQLSGFACDTEGNLLEGIDICLILNNYGIEFEIGISRTDANGKFQFSNVGFQNVYFKTKNNIYFLRNLNSTPSLFAKNIKLVFEKGTEYRLRVIDGEGKGIQNAKASSQNSELAQEFSAETDETGSCPLFLPKTGSNRLKIFHPDFLEYENKGTIAFKTQILNEITLTKGKTLSGKIIEQASLQPIIKAQVACFTNGYNTNICLTDANGNFHFTGLKNGTIKIKIIHSDYKEITSAIFISSNSDNIQKDFKMDHKNIFKITLVNKTNKLPISSKTIKLIDETQKFKLCTTNEKGELNAYLPDTILQKYGALPKIKVDGFSSFFSNFVITENELLWELCPAALLSCKITDNQDIPIEGVTFYENEYTWQEIPVSYESSKKSYFFKDLPEGNSIIYVKKSGFLNTRFSIDLIAEEEKLIELSLEKKFKLVFNLIFQDNNQNLSGLIGKIYIKNSNTYQIEKMDLVYNEEEKNFEIDIDNQDWDSFSIYFSNYLPICNINIQKPKEGVTTYEFSLVKGLGFSGQIVDEEGNSIPNAFINLNSNSNEYREGNAIDICCNENGHFSIFGLFASEYTINVSHPDFLDKELKLRINSQIKEENMIVLKKGIQFKGVISNSKGEKIINTEMRFYISSQDNHNSSYSDNFITNTDSKGNFELHKIPSGNYQVTIECETNYIIGQPIKIDSNAMEHHLILNEYQPISGQTIDSNNSPIKNIPLFAYQPGSCLRYEITSDENGYFNFPKIEIGKFKITVRNNNYTTEKDIFALAGDNNIRLILNHEPETAPQKPVLIYGSILTPDEKPIHDFTIEVNPDFGRVENLEFKDNSYKFTFYPSQYYVIVIIANASGYNFGFSKKINLSENTELPIDIILNSKHTLEVKVLDKLTRQPISNASIEINYFSDALEETKPRKKIMLNNKNGIAIIDDAYCGKYLITVDAAGYIQKSSSGEIFEKNNSKEILLEKGGSLKGQLFDWNNKPLPFVPVFGIKTERDNYSGHTEYLINTVSGENGYYEFTNAAEGEYLIYTEAYSRIERTPLFSGIPAKITDGQESNISIQEVIDLTKSTKIKISILGVSTSNMVISLYKQPVELDQESLDKNYLLDNRMDFNGNLIFLHVPNGSYLAMVRGDQLIGSTTFKVADEKELTIEIEVFEITPDEVDSGT